MSCGNSTHCWVVAKVAVIVAFAGAVVEKIEVRSQLFQQFRTKVKQGRLLLNACIRSLYWRDV